MNIRQIPHPTLVYAYVPIDEQVLLMSVIKRLDCC